MAGQETFGSTRSISEILSTGHDYLIYLTSAINHSYNEYDFQHSQERLT